MLVCGQEHIPMFLTSDSSRRKLSCNDFKFLCVGKLSKLLMFHLATSSLCYGDVITASAVGHRDQVTSPSRDDFTGSFFSSLCIDCSVNVDGCCVPLIVCLIFEGYLYLNFFFLWGTYESVWMRVVALQLWIFLGWFSSAYICASFYSLQLYCCLACKFLLLRFSSVLPF